MENILDEKIRFALLFGGLFVMYAIEFAIPLVKTYRTSVLKTIPNIVMALLLVLVNFMFSSITLTVSNWVTANEIGFFPLIGLSNTFACFFFGIVFLDLWAAYLPHVLLHKIPIFWRFHAVHHSDKMVDVTTSFRQHPFETVFRISFHITGMIILGIPLAVLLTYLIVSAIHAQIEHANIHINKKWDRFLQYIIVTPNMHKVHHSKYEKETDSNYSNILSIWDRLFGTFIKKNDYTTIEYGLEYLEDNDSSVREMLIDIPRLTKENQLKRKRIKMLTTISKSIEKV